MPSSDTHALLEEAPRQHTSRCLLAKSAIDAHRWPAAACGLRSAATQAQDWANRARALADWCDAQAESRRLQPSVPATPESAVQSPSLEPASPPTVEAIEAGLMVLAHSLGRDYAVRTRRAMNGVLDSTAAHQGSSAIAKAATA